MFLRALSFILAACGYSAALADPAAPADPPLRPSVPMLNFTVGDVGVLDDDGKPLRLGAEYRFKAIGRWRLIPAVGFAAALWTSRGSADPAEIATASS